MFSFPHRYTLLAIRWLHAWSLPLLLLFNLSLPTSASPSHPSDEKEHSSHFPRNISAASLGSLIAHHHSVNHTNQTEPSVTDPLMGTVRVTGDTDTHIDMEKNEVQVSPSLQSLQNITGIFTVLIYTSCVVSCRESQALDLVCIGPSPNMNWSCWRRFLKMPRLQWSSWVSYSSVHELLLQHQQLWHTGTS